MIQQRKNQKKAYIVGNKLFVNGQLWKDQGSAECDVKQNRCNIKTGNHECLNVCSWNISKGIIRKLKDGNF